VASLHQTAGGTYNLSFRYQGKQHLRSLETKHETEAKDGKTLIERTLRLLKEGVLTMPDGISADQFWQLLRSGGKVEQLPTIAPTIRLDKLCERYLNSFGRTGKEATTLDTEQHHINHFTRLMGKATALASIGSAELRDYVSSRESENGTHGRKVQPVTIAKELQTYWFLSTIAPAIPAIVRLKGNCDAHQTSLCSGPVLSLPFEFFERGRS